MMFTTNRECATCHSSLICDQRRHRWGFSPVFRCPNRCRQPKVPVMPPSLRTRQVDALDAFCTRQEARLRTALSVPEDDFTVVWATGDPLKRELVRTAVVTVRR